MIHQYRAKGYNIVLDVYSGSVHLVDDITYDIIELFDKDKKYIKKEIQKLHNISNEEFEESLSEVESLKNQNLLFSKDDFKDITIDIDNKKTYLKAMCLNVSHTCNLSCEYCFAKGGRYHGPEAIMTWDVAKSAIDFLLKNSGSHFNLDIDFFGGEPLLNWELVKKTIDYARSKEEEYNKHFNFTLTTNGVLLDDEKIDYLNENMKNVVLSLDGRKEKHDEFRKTIDGRGSFDKIVPKFQKLVEKRGDKEYYMRGTFTANNLDFTEDIKTYLNLGFKRTSLEPVVGNSEEDYALKEEHLPKIYNEYEKLADMLIEAVDKDNKFIFYHYMIDLNNGPCVYKRISGCGSGSEYMAVTPTGDLYPCHQFVGNENFKIGDVYDGIKREDLISNFKKNNLYSQKKCRDCWAQMYCSGGCAANNFNAGGDINKIYDYGCKVFKKRIEMALAVKIHEFLRENEKEEDIS
ncbi:thioether cross-link-forming SCIFF peptide maturase [Anaerococcus porci]|uniref:Thioether cross-link-forming SCIFF peptide maturase n=1 Tax=Anaerococcus porci TaxID=2652269 RepID=A0A6N7VWF7_9FIRM|nr:thioether cross-link-forming SCIFF peptide maturase [Anaerococcus porci]MDY3006992.1 thioether cross-link-forming SCIFF peptide maturase [Anaerococcus porci]MSS78187.1 thioether cross-link-forming SCIFF peptide maturase [Anaerococcus porci]